jgi:alkanesulfonate monooxygenase
MKLRLVGSCPRSDQPVSDYLAHVRATARMVDRARWESILVYTDNRLVNPWLVAQLIAQSTERLRPLLAVQPVYMHPYTVANLVTSLAFLTGRGTDLNLVAGGFPKDLAALDDRTPHDQRYERVIEYATIIRQLLGPEASATFAGNFYRVSGVRLHPPMPQALAPLITMSGSSEASIAAVKKLGAVAIQYLRPAQDYAGVSLDPTVEYGTRLGIIARTTNGDAWDAANKRFPDDKDGQLAHKFAARISDSVWVKELEREVHTPAGHPYWLGPYKNYQAFSPFLVGSTDEVALELSSYMRLGYRTFLVECPADEHDFACVEGAVAAALALARA